MARQSKLIDRLVNELTKMPGVGRKTAQRLTYFLLKAPEGYVENLARLLNEVKQHVSPCREMR
jgi:recombination protein RecR